MTNGEKYKTAKERAEAFAEHRAMSWNTPLEEIYGWLDLEAPPDEEEPLPCPFCGSHTVVGKGTGCFYVHCSSCNYESSADSRPIDVIAAHNRVARAVQKEANDANA